MHEEREPRARGSYHDEDRVVSAHVYHGETALVTAGLRRNRIAGRKVRRGAPTLGNHKTGVVGVELPTKNIQDSESESLCDVRGARVSKPE